MSYYDYYQPEAYLPTTGTYIEKDLQVNDEIEKLRISASSALLSGRRDVIVVCSVSCIYGIGNPTDFKKNIIEIEVGKLISRNKLLHQLVGALYSRTTEEESKLLCFSSSSTTRALTDSPINLFSARKFQSNI